jgi:hypothetical protein
MTNITKSDFAALDEHMEKQVDIQVDRLRRKGDPETHWTLDKKVPIGLMIALVTQFALGVWVVANDRAETNGKIALITADVETIHDSLRDSKESMKELALRFNLAIERVDQKLDRIIERGK